MSKEYDDISDGFGSETPKEIYSVAKWMNINGNNIFFESAYLYETGVTLIFLKKAEPAEAVPTPAVNTYGELYLREYTQNPDNLPTPVFDTEINGLRAREASVAAFNFEDGERFFPGLKDAVRSNESIPSELLSGGITVIKTDLIYYETIKGIEKIELREPESIYKNRLVRKDFMLDYGAEDVRIEYETQDGEKSFFIVEKFGTVNLKTLFLSDDEYISRYLDEGRSLEAIAKGLEEMNCDSDYIVMTLRRPEESRMLNFYLREHLEHPLVFNEDLAVLQDFGYKDSRTDDGLYKTMWIFNETKGIVLKDTMRQSNICLFSVTDTFETGMNIFFSTSKS